MKQIPNILTLGNLFCGALAIIFILNAPQYLAQFDDNNFGVTAPEPVYWASGMLVLAAIFDFLDGMAARALGVQSPMGKELDSLADVVSFGLVPGMILFRMLRICYMQTDEVYSMNYALLAPALLVPCFAAYRLAKFNLDTRQTTHFIGVPTPAVGLLVASFPLIMLYNPRNIGHYFTNYWVLYAIIAVLCYLMVAEIPMLSFKFKGLKDKSNVPRLILVIATAASIPLLGFASVPFAFLLYVILSLVFKPKSI